MNLFRFQNFESLQRRKNNRSRKAGSAIRPRFDWKASNLSNRNLLFRRLVGRSADPLGAFTEDEFIVISLNVLYLEVEDGNF
jgi:hypothetical protein